MFNKIIGVIIFLALLLPVGPVIAQSGDELPVYIVQQGDTINLIAVRFGVSAQDIIATNQIENPNLVAIGTRLRIPGIPGVRGTLITQSASLGSSLLSLSRAYQVEPDILVRINRLTSPSQIYVGSTVILPAREDISPYQPVTPLSSNQSALEYAALVGANPWVIALSNQKTGYSKILPGEPLVSPTAPQNTNVLGSTIIQFIDVSPLPLVQGKTHVINIQASSDVTLTGTLNGKPLAFYAVGDQKYVAIQGIHALAQPGMAMLSIQASLAGEEVFSFEQAILLEPGYYPRDPVLYVDPVTLSKENTEPEDELIRTITSAHNPEKYWDGVFRHPVDEPVCIRSWFGNRRSYNDGPYEYFHTGVDYGVCANLNIYAPAPGRVVYIGDLTVRGLSTIIDHGWGVYSGFWHQASTAVQVGDFVQSGQLIGEIGGSGRATGPHLHWELWANGVQVEPLAWIENPYP